MNAVRHLLRLLASSVVLLAACGGREQPTAAPAKLDPPQAAVVAMALCDAPKAQDPGIVSYRADGGSCRRSFTAMDTAMGGSSHERKRILATAPTRIVSATELLDYAERAYAQYFPSRRTNLLFAGYTYRYYPESQNHVGVSGSQIYVQGPVSGGSLAFVGTLEQFTCAVDPTACGVTGRSCEPIASWTMALNICTPNANQRTPITSGTTFTYTDTEGTSGGSATYLCNDGTLALQGTAVCNFVTPLPCSASAVSWSANGQTCTPDAGSPAQVSSGSSVTFQDTSPAAVGSATYSCSNGALSQTGTPTCAVPPLSSNCPLPASVSWSVAGNACFADLVPAQIAHGGSFTFVDSSGDTSGVDTLSCGNGILQRVGTALCELKPRVKDSFGGDGGPADGGDNGDGTAADGLPIVGAIVRFKDTTGKFVEAQAPTDAQGYFRAKLTGMVPPLIITVIKNGQVVRRSLSTQALKKDAYIFIAATSLTDKIVSDMANAAGFPGPAGLEPGMIPGLSNQLTAIINTLRNDAVVNPAIVAAGANPATFDFLTAPFRPNGTGYDKVLDNVIAETDNNGAIVIRTADCTLPTSWTVSNLTCTPDSGQPTTMKSGGSTVILRDGLGSTRGTIGYNCSRGVILAPVSPNCIPGPPNN